MMFSRVSPRSRHGHAVRHRSKVNERDLTYLLHMSVVLHILVIKRATPRPYPPYESSRGRGIRDACDVTSSYHPPESPVPYHLPPDLFPGLFPPYQQGGLCQSDSGPLPLRNGFFSHPSSWSHLNFEYETGTRTSFEQSGDAVPNSMVRDTTTTAGSLTEPRQQSKRVATLKLRYRLVRKSSVRAT